MKAAKTLLKARGPEGAAIAPEVFQAVMTLWADFGIRTVYSLRNVEYHLNECASYFFDNIERIMKPDYLPTTDDLLRLRIRTTGIEEARFVFDSRPFK